MKAWVLCSLLFLVGCAAQEAEVVPAAANSPAQPAWRFGKPSEVQLPAAGATVPALSATGDDRVVLGWMEPLGGKKHRFRLATRIGSAWSDPVDVLSSSDFIVNWADTPNVALTADGTLFAQWLERSGDGPYDYAVHVASSRDGGRSWSKGVVPHGNTRPSEYGFVSMRPVSPDSVALAWLDGRDMKEEGEGEMALRYARLDATGTLREEARLDARVCECCQTGMTMVDGAPLVVYRDRDANEIRDTAITRQVSSTWTPPVPVHTDGWKMPGCPVNGPQIDATGRDVAVAWFNGAEEKNRVFVAFSGDGGTTFGKSQLVSSSESLGRVGLTMVDGDHAAVSWMEKKGDAALIQLRIMAKNGTSSEPLTVGTTTAARSSGFPRLARTGNNLILVWTIAGEQPRIAMSEIPLEKVSR